MARFAINADELDALRGLPRLARDIYFMALRPHMDFATGIVGVARKISWRSIAEDVFVEPHQGIADSGLPTEKQLRRAVEWLERAELVGRNTNSNRSSKSLVFQLLKADTDLSAKNKVGSKWAVFKDSEVEGHEASNHAASAHKQGSYEAGSKNPKVGIHPSSGIPTTTTARARVNVPDDSIPTENPSRGVPADWQPSEYAIAQLKDRFNSEEITALLPEFRIYWNSRVNGNHLQTLDHKFVQHAIRTITAQRKRNEDSNSNQPKPRNTHEQNHAHFRTPTKTPKPNIRQMHERNQSEAERVIAEAYAEMQRLAAEGGNG